MEQVIKELTKAGQNKNRQLLRLTRRLLDEPNRIPWERKTRADQIELEAAELAGVLKGIRMAVAMCKDGAMTELPFENAIQEHYRPDYQHKIAAEQFQRGQQEKLAEQPVSLSASEGEAALAEAGL
jgi:hypothetical protein